MEKFRKVKKIFKGQRVLEGAGVKLKRIFGNNDTTLTDPFLLLDDFHSDKEEDYIKGFPQHPHRGIETITYVLYGDVRHGDSLGNSGTISDGDVQWMTAGSGIIHEEMPEGDDKGLMWGFQLWANLPRSQKMCKPLYRDVKNSDIPKLTLDNGTKIKIISGEVNGVKGPVADIAIKPEYLDITLPAGISFTRSFENEHTVFAYIIEGDVEIKEDDSPAAATAESKTDALFSHNADKGKTAVPKEQLVLFDAGDAVRITGGSKGGRFLLVSGKPLKEPVAWYGPIVMNTDDEIKTAIRDLKEGTFIK
ncbi:MAG: pirin family protein [Spirochaetia bacterium]|jgi:redox-sensitive bicupin YhaK (pirin superfamily)|nr:pirin family protein [Spirochaetia bacterium]